MFSADGAVHSCTSEGDANIILFLAFGVPFVFGSGSSGSRGTWNANVWHTVRPQQMVNKGMLLLHQPNVVTVLPRKAKTIARLM